MIFTIDVGNSNIVLGGYKEESLLFVARISTSTKRTADEYAVSIKEILDIRGYSNQDIEGVIISSVVPHITTILYEAIKLFTGIAPIVVGPGMKTGINIKIDDPAQLGSDLLVDSVAAAALYEKPCIVVDMGTATTISAVTENNEMIGGAIIPGVKISIDALAEKTAQLPHIALIPPKKAIGTNTISCMQSGLIYGNAGMIDGIVERIEEELGKKCTVVATGGLAKEICNVCRHEIIYDEYLMLKGLYILYKKNSKASK
ncbi:MAG: type III pantothenate kinase [Clostridia bacterium]|nr:type III pantothenate kinase [Clostridia bacterium]